MKLDTEEEEEAGTENEEEWEGESQDTRNSLVEQRIQTSDGRRNAGVTISSPLTHTHS